MLSPWIKVNWKWSNKMARVNTDILGISELKWSGIGEFNSDYYIYYCGQESLRRNEVALIVRKRVQNAVKVKLLSCVWLCDTMDCSLPDSSVPGIFQTRVLEWIAISFARGSSQPRDGTALQAEALLSEPPGKPQNAVLGCNLKNDRMISVHFQSNPLNIIVIQVYAPTAIKVSS